MDIAIPKRVSHTSSRPRPMWMDADTFNKVRGKHRTWNKYKRTGTREDLYVRARNQSRWLTRNAVRTFERSLASTVRQNPKAFWKYARSKTQVKTGVADLENEEGILTSSDKEKVEVMNRFYSSVFTQENTDNIPALRRPHYEEELTDLQSHRRTWREN